MVYSDIFPYQVELGLAPGEDFDTHYEKFGKAHRWCESNIGKHHKSWQFTMRGGKLPFLFEFKKPKQAMMFKLRWSS